MSRPVIGYILSGNPVEFVAILPLLNGASPVKML